MKKSYIYIILTITSCTSLFFFTKFYPSLSLQIDFFKNIMLLCSILFTVMGLWLSLFYNQELKDIFLENENNNLKKAEHLENIKFLIKPMVSTTYILILSLIILGIYILKEPLLSIEFIQNHPKRVNIIKEIIKSFSFSILILSTIKIIDNTINFMIPLKNILRRVKKINTKD